MAAAWKTTQFSSDEDFEILKNLPHPHMRELLQLLVTEIPALVQNAQRELDEKSTKAAETEILKKNLRQLQRQNEELEKKFVQKENHQIDIASKSLQAKVVKLEKRLSHEERSKSEIEKKLKNELHDSQQTIESLKRKVQIAEDESRNIKAELMKRERQDTNLRKELESYDNLERQLKKIKEELKNTKDELEDTKSRLSKSMGDKLTDNNPNIADLSDKNRPTKLAERYQEIYDNEWTDAFETLDAIYNDDAKTTSTLIHILAGTKDFCDREAVYQMEQIQKSILQNLSSPHKNLPLNVQKQLKDCRKAVAGHSGKYLYQKYHKELLSSKSNMARRARRVPEFVEACFNMCWIMAVQDPPIVFSPNTDQGDKFNTDMYKAYTRTGNKVDFVVWPALNLHTDGPILCKGVAQGYSESSRRSNSAPPENRQQNQSYETTPENNKDIKMKPKSNDNASQASGSKSNLDGRTYVSSTRKADNSYRNTPVARQSRTTFKPKNLSQYNTSSPTSPKPSENDVDTFLRWRDMFGPNEARRLMGQDYDICLKYLKGLGFI